MRNEWQLTYVVFEELEQERRLVEDDLRRFVAATDHLGSVLARLMHSTGGWVGRLPIRQASTSRPAGRRRGTRRRCEPRFPRQAPR